MARPILFPIDGHPVRFYPNEPIGRLRSLLPGRRLVLITDQHVYRKHPKSFAPFDTIVLRAGEKYKVQATVDSLIDRLIALEVDRTTVLVGVGGGVVTDLVGYLACVYMRGIDVGFVPTTILSMVDASIGGKNGVDVGRYKNLVGSIRQPLFILHDYELLSSLPKREWSNGFAEIIKHAAIGDADLFEELCRQDLRSYQTDRVKLQRLIVRNVRFKIGVVKSDPYEKAGRKYLNFGHTLGHALEMQYDLSHGEAISLGMMFAAQLSSEKLGFSGSEWLQDLLRRYGLPVKAGFSAKKVFRSLSMDKKRVSRSVDFILLKKIGQATHYPISLNELASRLQQYV
jgi:3-dehydroquinate synthase